MVLTLADVSGRKMLSASIPGSLEMTELLMVIVMRKTITVSNENRKLSDSLRENAAKLEGALSQLSVYTAELEKTADLRARDKLMHELHDKLGHSLSTASIAVRERSASPASERTDQLCAMESIRHSELLAEPRGEPSSK